MIDTGTTIASLMRGERYKGAIPSDTGITMNGRIRYTKYELAARSSSVEFCIEDLEQNENHAHT